MNNKLEESKEFTYLLLCVSANADELLKILEEEFIYSTAYLISYSNIIFTSQLPLEDIEKAIRGNKRFNVGYNIIIMHIDDVFTKENLSLIFQHKYSPYAEDIYKFLEDIYAKNADPKNNDKSNHTDYLNFILEKISNSGINSLTKEELNYLNTYSR